MFLVLCDIELSKHHPAFEARTASHKTRLIDYENNEEIEAGAWRRHLRACQYMVEGPKFLRLVISFLAERTADLL
jgi:hypothetical protein